MALIRWNPTSDLMSLHSEMDRIFGELTEGLGAPRIGGNGGEHQAAFLPIDIERQDNALVVRASVPGFAPNEVNVTVDSGVLTIDARHEKNVEKAEGEVLRHERFTGRLFRQISLGEGIDGDKVKAKFENGVLTVTAPLIRRSEPKKIAVQSASS